MRVRVTLTYNDVTEARKRNFKTGSEAQPDVTVGTRSAKTRLATVRCEMLSTYKYRTFRELPSHL